jgi:hypothetical protein
MNHKHRNYSHVANFVTETWVDTPKQSCSYASMLPKHNDVQLSSHGTLQKLLRKRSILIALEYLLELLLPSSGQSFGYSRGRPVF